MVADEAVGSRRIRRNAQGVIDPATPRQATKGRPHATAVPNSTPSLANLQDSSGESPKEYPEDSLKKDMTSLAVESPRRAARFALGDRATFSALFRDFLARLQVAVPMLETWFLMRLHRFGGWPFQMVTSASALPVRAALLAFVAVVRSLSLGRDDCAAACVVGADRCISDRVVRVAGKESLTQVVRTDEAALEAHAGGAGREAGRFT